MQIRIRATIIAFMIVARIGAGVLLASAQAVRGNRLAPVTIIEYADFQWPTCARVRLIVDCFENRQHGAAMFSGSARSNAARKNAVQFRFA